MSNQKGWLTALGEEELNLVKSMGYDHQEVKAARRRWTEAYETVLNIRRCYGLPSHIREED